MVGLTVRPTILCRPPGVVCDMRQIAGRLEALVGGVAHKAVTVGAHDSGSLAGVAVVRVAVDEGGGGDHHRPPVYNVVRTDTR
jgi:hypothetical protein